MTKQIIRTILAGVVFLCATKLWSSTPPPLPDQSGSPLPIAYNANQCIGGTWHTVIATHWSFLWFSGDEVNPNYQIDTKVACCKEEEGKVVFAKLKSNLQPRLDTPSMGDCKLCAMSASGGVGSAGGSVASMGFQAAAGASIARPLYPLPYRPFALPALNFGSKPPAITLQCNSELNPTAFHVLHYDALVTRINLCTSHTIAAVKVNTSPLQVAITPDGKFAIVTHYDNAISFISTDTNTVAKVIQTGGDVFPSGISISSDGSFALVTSYIDTRPALLVLDLAQQSIVRTIPLARTFPQSVFLNPDATLAWVTYPFGNVVDVVDVLTGIVNNSLSAGEPIQVVFNPTGTVAYISSMSPGSVIAVDTTTYATIKNIVTAAGSSDMQLGPDGGFLMVNNFDSNSVSTIDTRSLTVLRTVSFSGPPLGIMPVPVQ